MGAVIVKSINAFSTVERAAEVEAFLAQSPVPSCERKIAQCVETIRNNAQMLIKAKASKLTDAAFWAQ